MWSWPAATPHAWTRPSAVGLTAAERRLADTKDHDGLMAAFRGCDAVINCAGPFTPSGEGVVRAAIAAGCHYVDTAGEQFYIKKIFDTFAAEAERAEVTVIPATNDACVPGDLIAHLLAGRVEPRRSALGSTPQSRRRSSMACPKGPLRTAGARSGSPM
jgi:short subunit dehydrogenase-like uncharacterized protein